MDLEAFELAIRHSMHQLGGVLMEKLIHAEKGDHRRTRMACDAGHEAEFREYRTKSVTTVLSEMAINRAYYLMRFYFLKQKLKSWRPNDFFKD